MELDATQYTSQTIQELGRIGSCASDEIAKPRRLSGGDIVPLSGSPRCSPPDHVVSAVHRMMSETGYAPGRGLPDLKEAVAQRIRRSTSTEVDPETQVVVVNGGMQALHVVMLSLIDAGDEVVIPTPCYSYDGLVRLASGNPVYVPMLSESGYSWDLDRIRAAISPRTKLLVVNTPVNPTGRVLNHDELVGLVEIANEHDLLILADEAYDRLVYDGRSHESIMSIESAAARTVLVQSATKSFSLGAWRLGWIVAPSSFVDIFAKTVEWTMIAVSRAGQAAAAAAITGPHEWLDEMVLDFQQNRDVCVKHLNEFSELSFVQPQGGPFVLPDVSALELSGDDFAKILITEHGLRVTGGSYYHAPDCIRIPFGGTQEALDETFRRMRVAIDAL